MSLVLRPLLDLSGSLFDRLWHIRMRKPVDVLLPDWADPCLPDPFAAAPDRVELKLRARIGAIAERLRALGPTEAVREALRARGGDPDRLAALLALTGCAPWAPTVLGAASRRGADGATYLLRATPGEGAPHAPHAVLMLDQCLLIRPDAAALSTLRVGAVVHTRCLSLACALRDVVVRLAAAGELALAAEVARAGRLDAALMPPLPAERIAA